MAAFLRARWYEYIQMASCALRFPASIAAGKYSIPWAFRAAGALHDARQVSLFRLFPHTPGNAIVIPLGNGGSWRRGGAHDPRGAPWLAVGDGRQAQSASRSLDAAISWQHNHSNFFIAVALI